MKWVGITLLALILLLVVGGSLISQRYTVSRSALIDAPPEKVFALVADPRAWKDWSIWLQRDPGMTLNYGGAASGAGAKWQWKSQSQGDGMMIFTGAEPPRRLAFELTFSGFNPSNGDFSFTPEGAGTRITWTMNGDMGSNPAFHWLALLTDRLIGKDFEAGLANLKRLAEKR